MGILSNLTIEEVMFKKRIGTQFKGYLVIEVDICETLHWDMDLIVQCLELFRKRLTDGFESIAYPDPVELVLMHYRNRELVEYPIIGLKTPHNEMAMHLPVISLIPHELQVWIKEDGIEQIKKEAQAIKVISWENLKKAETYPGLI